VICVTRAARWRPTNRQIWLTVLASAILACGAATAMPVKRTDLLPGVLAFVIAGYLVTDLRRERQRREELAACLARVPRDSVPADVIALIATGKKIQAIKCYRDLTGVSLRQAKAIIDSL
jgi:hypothetical protein